VLVAIIKDSHYFRVMRIPELSPAVFAHGLYYMWNTYEERRKAMQDKTDIDDMSVLTVDSSASRAVAVAHNVAVCYSTAAVNLTDADFGDPVTSVNNDHAPLNDDCNRAMPSDSAVGNDDVASEADVNPMSSGDEDFVSAKGKYYHLYNNK
jgi:hypothetical protein